MTVRLRFFASLRDLVGVSESRLELAGPATPEDAFRSLAARHPDLQARRPSLLVAVNRRYVPFDTPLRDGDEVVFIPPVSGG